MENLMESNERTLVIFDSVCSGLASCLALVHADIKQMTEHRNRLAQLERDQLQAKLLPPDEMLRQTSTPIKSSSKKSPEKAPEDAKLAEAGDEHEDDPHHLSKLKLLDKRLADTFSHALSMNDLQKSSIHAKHQAVQNRPSLFQVLLGKSAYKTSGKHNQPTSQQAAAAANDDQKPDNRTMIDDINKQTRLAMQYSKQLEANLLKVEDLRTKYEMHLKMGLVVKSVAKVYLSNGAGQLYGGLQSGGAASLAPGRRHHCSSLVINDSSSLGTRSSLSSLNLSTWSTASRCKAREKRQEALNNYHLSSGGGGSNNNNYVSTLSLNQQKNNHRRLSLSRLISSSAAKANSTSPYDEQGGFGDPRNVVSSQLHAPEVCQPAKYCDNGSPRSIGASGSLSKSSANLYASQSSLKRNKGSLKRAQASATGSSKTTIKEFIDNIGHIETEFETYMGSFMLAIEDIQGFARVCQGDVFEVNIKYGESQKFKTKISVLKDNRQKCANRQAIFKARIADVLAIKAHECKGLGKRVLLGHKLCETKDLFTPRSQLMTISLNQTGSIKLNLIVTWNPLHLAPNSTASLSGLDISHVSLPPTPVSSSTISSTNSSVPSMNGAGTGAQLTTINIQAPASRQHQQHHVHHHEPHCRAVGVGPMEFDPDSQVVTISKQRHLNHHERQNSDSIYQSVDPTYGYYIPPPDYLSTDVNY